MNLALILLENAAKNENLIAPPVLIVYFGSWLIYHRTERSWLGRLTDIIIRVYAELSELEAHPGAIFADLAGVNVIEQILRELLLPKDWRILSIQQDILY